MLATGIKNIIKNAEEAEIRGMEIGKTEEKIEIVRKALAKGYNIKEVADLTGLPVEQIQKLMSEN